MVTKHCCYGTCNSDTRYNHKPHMQGVTFLRFPQPSVDMEKCKLWIAACQRVGFTVDSIKNHTYICTKHFVGGKGPTDQYPDPIPAGLEPMVRQIVVTENLTYPTKRQVQIPSLRKNKRLDEINTQYVIQKSAHIPGLTPNSNILPLQEDAIGPPLSLVRCVEGKKKVTCRRKRRASAPSVLSTLPHLKQKQVNVTQFMSKSSVGQATKRKNSCLTNAISRPTVSLVPCMSESGELVLVPVNSIDLSENQQLLSSVTVSNTEFARDFPLLVPTVVTSIAEMCESTNLSTSGESSVTERKILSESPNATTQTFDMCFMKDCVNEATLPCSALTVGLISESTDAKHNNNKLVFISDEKQSTCDLGNLKLKVEPASEVLTTSMFESINLQSKSLVAFSRENEHLELIRQEKCSPVTGLTTYKVKRSNKSGESKIHQPFSISVDMTSQLCNKEAVTRPNIPTDNRGSVTEQRILTETIDSLLLLETQNSVFVNESCSSLDGSAMELSVQNHIEDRQICASLNAAQTSLDRYGNHTIIADGSITESTVLMNIQCCSSSEGSSQKKDLVAEPLLGSCAGVCRNEHVPPIEILSMASVVDKCSNIGSKSTRPLNNADRFYKRLPTKSTVISRNQRSLLQKKFPNGGIVKTRGKRKKLYPTPVAVTYIAGSDKQQCLPQNVLPNSSINCDGESLDLHSKAAQLPPVFTNTTLLVLNNASTKKSTKVATSCLSSSRRRLRPIAPNTSVFLGNKLQGESTGLAPSSAQFFIHNTSPLHTANQSIVSSWKLYSDLMLDGWTVRLDEKRNFHLINNFGVSKSVVVDKDQYCISIFDNELPSNHPSLSSFPGKITTDNDLRLLLKRVKGLNVCVGNSEEKFIRMVLETSLPKVKYCRVSNSVYSFLCNVALTDGLRCDHCARLRTVLKHMVRRKEKKYLKALPEGNIAMEKEEKLLNISSTNAIPEEPKVYLSVVELRSKIYFLKRKLKAERQKNLRLRIKLKNTSGVEKDVVEKEPIMPVDLDTFDKDSFCYKFIQEQIRASKCKHKGMRWHPFILKWCTNLRNKSPVGYTLMRQEFRLPSERTLCNYVNTHHTNHEKNRMNMLDRNDTSDLQECVITVIRRPEDDNCLLLNAGSVIADARNSNSGILTLTGIDSNSSAMDDASVPAEIVSLTNDGKLTIQSIDGSIHADTKAETAATMDCSNSTITESSMPIVGLHSNGINFNFQDSICMKGQEIETLGSEKGAIESTATGQLHPVINADATAETKVISSSNDEHYTVAFVGDSSDSEVVQYIIQDFRQALVTIDGTEYMIEETVPLATRLDEHQ